MKKFSSNNIVERVKALTPQEKQKLLDYIGTKCVEFLKNRLTQVYSINVPLTKRDNYIPLENLFRGINVKIQTSTGQIILSLDEDAIRWRDGSDLPIYPVAGPNYKHVPITTFAEYWQMPIQGKREDAFFFANTLSDCKNFLQKEFVNYLNQFINSKKEGV